jgi:hypothetical protein
MNVRKDPTAKQQLSLIKKEINLDDLLSVYPEEAIDKLVANKDKLLKISEMFGDTMTTVSKATMILQCDTSKCPFKNSCILIKNSIAPNGYQCPIEKKLVMEIESSIIQELDIDTQNTIEMELLYDFIEAKLLDMRTSGMIADTSVVQLIEIDNGKAVNRYKDVAPEFKVKMDLKKLKSSIMEEFMATRKAKKRYGLSTGNDSFEDIIKKAMSNVDVQSD